MYRSLALAAASAVLSAQLAFAADLPTKAPLAPAPMMPPVYNWTGFYIGGQVGGGWGHSTTTPVDASASFPAGFVQRSLDPSGVLGGVYGGYNYQWGQLVLGIDGDYSWARLNGSAVDARSLIPPNTSDVALHTTKLIGSRPSRAVSVTHQNNWMFFVKGGGAWAGFEANCTLTQSCRSHYNSALDEQFGNPRRLDRRHGCRVGHRFTKLDG